MIGHREGRLLPAVAVVGAGAVLANPGAFIPIALKAISESHPSPAEYSIEWPAFTAISPLPLITALAGDGSSGMQSRSAG